jgi:hypothetical protein
MAYFERLSDSTFLATEHVSGAWNTAEQHIAPALGLLAHAVEADRDARRDDGLVLTRLSYDILGTVAVAEVEVAVRVLRAGRTIELVEATLFHAGRSAVILRAWLQLPGDTAELAGGALVPIPPPDQLPPWDPTTVWPGGFIASVELRRSLAQPGRAAYWVRPGEKLLDGEPVSPLARAAGLLDISNGMAVRVHPRQVAFPNLDLTAHLFRQPRGDWLGFDTTVSFGAHGVGLTSSVLHDGDGPIGTMSQILTVRPF